MTCPEADLVKHLHSANERIARFAWHAIADAKQLSGPTARALVTDPSQSDNVRCLAFGP